DTVEANAEISRSRVDFRRDELVSQSVGVGVGLKYVVDLDPALIPACRRALILEYLFLDIENDLSFGMVVEDAMKRGEALLAVEEIQRVVGGFSVGCIGCNVTSERWFGGLPKQEGSRRITAIE